MDPNTLVNPDWSDIGNILTNLWIMVGLVVLFATNLLIGHIFIPSLVDTGHIPQDTQKFRPAFYLLALVAFVFTIFFLIQSIDVAVFGPEGEGVIDRFFKRFWI